MATSDILTALDHCARSEYLARSWELNSLRPAQILNRAVQFGLESCADDAGLAANDEAMRLCVERTFDTDDGNLIGVAQNISFLAEMIVWMVKGGGWERPEDVRVGNHVWESSAFLRGNRPLQVLLVDSWTIGRKQAALNSWAIGGEMAMYGIPMTLIVAVIGKRREGRWRSPLTQGYEHPVSRDLRFRKRDGESFGSTWERVWREDFRGTREDWLNSLTDDGLLPELLTVEELDMPDYAQEIRTLAERKLDGLAKELPEPQLSVCDSPISPCQFRSACPNWTMPSVETGFISLRELQPRRS